MGGNRTKTLGLGRIFKKFSKHKKNYKHVEWMINFTSDGRQNSLNQGPYALDVRSKEDLVGHLDPDGLRLVPLQLHKFSPPH
ncbi:hypothetical protein C1H46_034809 [Malus baccata]|uniref:Uncharacterized protein n=1 Tax=Malus baccata TaxID=106549 RepID=A0A540L044_MALBA|nr:hypothetical protein C1H46_034809 [Malus baccata]